MKKLLSLVVVAVLALGLTACGEPTVTSANYRTTYAAHYDTLNYLVSQSAGDNEYTANLVDGLVEVNRLNQIQPALAESWEVSTRDGKQVWTFKIKQGINWQYNASLEPYGEEVTAQNWVTSANYILNPTYASELVGLLTRFVDGAANYNCSKLVDLAEAEGTEAPHCADEDDYVYNTDFSQVGVKAIDDYTLEYTMVSPAPYFLTALTYNSFYPVSENFLLETGDEFGKDSSFLLINGAYSLTTDEMDTQIELTKNPEYWDADNVFISTITYYFAGGDIGPDFYRLKFEAGEIDGFKIKEDDQVGWDKYIVGEDGSGSVENPYAPEAYVKSTVSPYTYYYLFNFARENYDGSELTEEEHALAEAAIMLPDFRVGLLHGMHRPTFTAQYTPNNPAQWVRNTYTPRELATDQNGRDYVDYVIDVIAEKTGEDRDTVATNMADGMDGNYDVALATEKLEAAKAQLIAQGFTEEDFPIKFETVCTDNNVRVPYYEAFRDKFNAEFGELAEMVLVYPTNGDEWSQYSNVKKSYDMRINMGWGPDYADPSTYLNTYAIKGDMLSYSNLSNNQALQNEVLGAYDALYRVGVEITDEDKIDERFREFAEAEYQLLFEDAVIVPNLSPRGDEVYVSRIKPYTVSSVTYGLAKAKYKGMVVLETPITREERQTLKAEYEAAQAK